MAEDYPVLANRDAYGRDAAGRLVRTGRVIPVLDGLDEMPPALHHAAISAFDNAVVDSIPLVVTCRGSEYQAVVTTSGRFLSRAAVVEIEPVTVEDTISFLRHTHTATDPRWQPVFDHLRQCPDGPLAHALSTPLMVHLARAAYSHPQTEPTDLCDPAQFSDSAAIEDHLLDAYLPTIYAAYPTPHPTPEQARAAAPVPYSPQRAQQWLRFLATHFNQLNTRDFAWWEIDRAVPRLVYGLAVGIGGGLAVSLMLGLAGGLMAGQVTTGLLVGLAAGFAGGLITGLRPTPRQVRQTIVRTIQEPRPLHRQRATVRTWPRPRARPAGGARRWTYDRGQRRDSKWSRRSLCRWTPELGRHGTSPRDHLARSRIAVTQHQDRSEGKRSST